MHRFSNLNLNWTVFFLLFILLTGGCATTAPIYHKSLDSNLTNQNYNTKVISNVKNEEISIRVKTEQVGYAPNTGALVQLAAVLIVKGINKSEGKKAEARMAPLLEATADVNFRTQYWNELEKALSQSPWLKRENLDKRSVYLTQKELDELKPPFLLLYTFYELSENAQVLIVQTKANLYLKDSKLSDYFGLCTYFSNPIGKNDEVAEKAIALWTANRASAYREALEDGIKQNINMLRHDLLDKPANPGDEKGEVARLRFRDPFSGVLDMWEGRVQTRNENRIVIRELDGNLFSIGTGLIE